MKISASYWMFEGGLEAQLPVLEAMKQARKLGFDAIELCIASKGVLTDKTTKAECQMMRRQAQRIGLEISSVASGQSWFTSPTSEDPAVRRGIIHFTKKALQVTRWLGTDAYLFVPGAVDVFFNPSSEVIPYDVCMKRSVQALRQLIPAAEKMKVTLCIENVWNKFLLSPLEMRDFIDGFDSKKVGSYFDVGNVLLTGYPEQWIRILGKRIKRVHIKDFKKSVGTAEGFVDLGEGNVDFKLVKKALAAIKYNGYVTAEMLPHVPGRPEKTARFMKKMFNNFLK